MQQRAGSGWQYAIADLSLILFMVAAAALAKVPRSAQLPVPRAASGPPELAEPVAVWRRTGSSGSLAAWLAAQPRDPRQRLTVVARYAGSDAARTAAEAARLLGTAPVGPGTVRIVIEPGAENDLLATLTWDTPAMAQPLQPALATTSLEKAR